MYDRYPGVLLHCRLRMRKTAAILCFIIVNTLFLSVLNAQNKGIGATFSYAGIGAEYAFDIDKANFAEFQLRMDTMEIYRTSSAFPGISASAFWNMIFARFESRNGNPVRFYAGPGISIGYTGDSGRHHGLVFGVKGRIGGECAFPRGISVAISISPMIGGHFGIRDNMVNMRLYRNGLIQSIMPEVSIRHKF